MAKKEKVQLTPEEIKEKKIRRSNGWTRFWAVVVAFALTAGVFAFAKTQSAKLQEESGETTTAASGSYDTAANANPSAGWSDSGTSTDNAASSGNSATPGSTPAASSGDSSGAATDAASVAQLINTATAQAVNSKVGYDWERKGVVENIDVGNATGALDKIIHTVDSNADLNSVVGGFLGRGDKSETVPKGQTLDTIDVPKDDGSTEKLYHGSSYTLKATQLQASDIQGLQINGDTYTFTLPDSSNPDRSGNTPLSRFCNDIVVVDEVNKEIQEQVGSAVTVNSLDASYHNIKVSVTIKDGKLVELSYSFAADAKLGIKAAILNINGSGNLTADAKYSNFVY